MQTENMMTFYEIGKTHLYSIATFKDGEWRTQYDHQTLEEVRAERGEAMQLLPFNEACRMIDDAQMAAYCHAPFEVTRQMFHEMLNVLPPGKWRRSENYETFFVTEALAADIHAWYVRIGARYWTLNRSCTRDADSIISEVATAAGVQS